MACGQFGFLCAALAASLSAQGVAPSFTRAGVVPAHSLLPGDLVTIYGQFLNVPCGEPLPNLRETYPTELCGTQVTVAGIPAGLLAVLEKQINLQIPPEAPTSGKAALVVIVKGLRSQTVTVPFGKPKVTLSLDGPAYVHMPVWISVKRPLYGVSYPYGLNPGNFGGGAFEVRQNGVILKPLQIPDSPESGIGGGLLNGSIAPPDSPRDRLPLHLKYRFDTPGKYEIRFIGTRLDFRPKRQEVHVDESDWTEIEILPYSEAQRSSWIREQTAKMPTSPGMLVGDAIPALLALPDHLALAAILPQLYHSSDLVRHYVVGSLTMFDTALVSKALASLIRDKGPTIEIAGLLDQTVLSAIPRFLTSGPPEVQAGAMQYLVWSQNHDWGKNPQFRTQLSALVLGAAPAILQGSDTRLQQLLAEALGSIKTDAARDLLWLMIDSGKSETQSKIALTWIGDPRDLPRLAGLLAGPNSDYSLPYSLHRAYGAAALPLLKQAARETTQPDMRIACAEELILAGDAEGFQDLLQATDQKPSAKPSALRFLRDHFPNLRDQNEEVLVAFLKSRINPSSPY